MSVEQTEIEIKAGGLPERLLLVPKGRFKGRDPRVFNNHTPETIVKNFKEDKRDIPIDINHNLETGKGDGAAVGWIKDVEVENGEVYGKVEWNHIGSDKINNKEYRYISPVFYLGKDKNIKKVESVGLVNKPNLYIKSLNSEGGDEEDDMPEMVAKELCSALGLEEGVSIATAVRKIEELKFAGAQKEMNVQGGDVVPKADYELAMNRAEKAEQALQEKEEEALTKEVNAVIDQAVEDGKIAPSSREFYVETCSTQEGLDKFKEFVKSAPRVLTENAGVDGNPETNTALSEEEKEMCATTGVSEEAYLATKQEEATNGNQ